MKIFVVLGAILAISSATYSPRLLQQHWNAFKLTYNKKYASVEEEAKRLAIFKDNIAKIDAHNALFDEGKTSYTMAINHFADMSSKEFMAYVNSSIIPLLPTPRKNVIVPPSKVRASSVDWRQQGIVTDVKNQGQCGSCWSFSATGALEGQYALKHGQLLSLSEQNLVDCSSNYGNGGCNGGWPNYAYQYVRDYGIDLEYNYPYEGYQNYCRWSGQSVLRVTGFTDFASSNDNIRAAVEENGPVSVAFDATNNLQFYSGGVFYDNSCDPNVLNHAVLIVGFGPDYWLVKNSWGTYWGEAGYFRLSNQGSSCGITTAASAPTVA